MASHTSALSVKSPVPSYRMFSYRWCFFSLSSIMSSLEMGKKNDEEYSSHLENPFSK